MIEETNGIEWRKIKNEYKCSQGKTLIAHGQGNSANTNSNFSGELGLALSIALELWADYHTWRLQAAILQMWTPLFSIAVVVVREPGALATAVPVDEKLGPGAHRIGNT